MIKSIQMLRAIAALSVVFLHYSLFGLEIGNFGVDIFFIISGFIISYVVNKTTKDFMWKRLVRVAPVYYLATLLTIVLALVMPHSFKHVIITTEAIIKSVLFIPYRINDSGPILSLGWTLNNEMLFYLVMFFCILTFKKPKYLVPACGGVLIVILLTLKIIDSQQFFLNFYENGLLPEFIYGLGIYYFWNYYKVRQNSSINTIFILAGIVSLVFLIYCDQTHLWVRSRNIVNGIPALLVVNALLTLENKLRENNLLVKLGIRLGDASYVMYLLHPFIIFPLQRMVYNRLTWHQENVIVELIKFLIAMILVCFVSLLLYKFIDKPINDKLRRLAVRPR